MGLHTFFKFLAHFSNIVSCPSFCLMYPIYASIRAIETDEENGYQRCLRYWVLFSIATIFEYTFAEFLVWISLWPFVKGIAAVLLAVPSFAGASYVYTRYIRPHTAKKSCLREVPSAIDCIQISNVILGKEGIHYKHDQELEEVVTCKDESKATCLILRNVLSNPVNIKQVQREWSCSLCLISTTSENCLRMHFKGKKHQIRVLESKEAKRYSRIIEKLNQITWTNYKKLSKLVSPVAKWATWKKPDPGWIKLNTDGSIDGSISGFGGLLRDADANPICGYHTRAPGDDIFLAELWAIWRGLVLAFGLGMKGIWVESDSMSVVKAINKEQGYPQKASTCLQQIWVFLDKFEKRHVSYAWRETNRAADCLSHMGVLGSDSVLWPGDFSTELLRIIREDAMGKKYYRR